MEDKNISAELVAETERYWNVHQRPLRLAELGKTAAAVRAKALSGSLSSYLTTYLPTQIAVLKHSTIPSLVGVIPAGKRDQVPNIDEALTVTAPTAAHSTMPRYYAAIWRAFRDPLTDGFRRFVTSTSPIEVRDFPADQPGSGIEIDRTLIVGTEDVASIHSAIISWSKDKNVELSKLLFSTKGTTNTANSLLERLLETLTVDDQKRISLPLDIVGRLHKTKL